MIEAGAYAMPLSEAFGDAYAEWLRVFDELRLGGQGAEAMAEQAAESASMLTRRLSRNAGVRVGAAGQAQIDLMQYLFVSLVDEKLLFGEWPGQTLWQALPLEQRLFGTRTAGEKAPDAMEKILRERDPASRDLANVCLQCLVLGFYGRLRGPGGLEQHEDWRRELFAFVHQREADSRALGSTLERSSASPPLRQEVRRMLPDGFRLMLGVAALALAVLLVGHVFWLDIERRVGPLLYQGDNGGEWRK
ncbi:DotU/TssL family secretion system protein [Chromobacterium paludis]|uniref:DotU family type IV/VI secretion system protein n=1 Tax=Chromobacterium paludis TaxID=2605945 RepID=A0A5C1DJ14_9NEIS|nr:DotU/TssL family secretion system protein [Chromobacterium paludis]QEL55949.1 DotU family type IV/VI secretion system protein [Chromobacterium paludis]